MKKLMLSGLALAVLAGCASTPKDEPRAAVEERAPVASSPQADSRPMDRRPLHANPLTDPNNILSQRSVYFAYDSAAVEAKYQPMIDAHAGYLNANRGARVFIQGNTDERGSREYNLALGQRRADAVRKLINARGVGDGQIETVSFGKEKPRAQGSDEAAWAQNRRADIVYQGEQ